MTVYRPSEFSVSFVLFTFLYFFSFFVTTFVNKDCVYNVRCVLRSKDRRSRSVSFTSSDARDNVPNTNQQLDVITK